MRTRIAIAAGGVLIAISGATPAGAIQHEVDYRNFTRCAYSPTDSGWALVGRAPKGTSSVTFLDSADGIITQQNVNTRCADTPSQWPQ